MSQAPFPGNPEPLNYQSPSDPLTYLGPPPDANARTWGMLAHLSGLVAGFIALPIIGPLVVWLIKKNEMPSVDHQGKEALNFHITLMIAFVALIPTFFILIGFVLYPILAVAAIVLMIIAAVKANDGIAYRYPFTLRLIK